MFSQRDNSLFILFHRNDNDQSARQTSEKDHREEIQVSGDDVHPEYHP
jgi:hypothetical protein